MNLPFEYDQRRRRRVRRHHADHHRFRARPRRHPAGSARSHDVVRARHAQRPARDSRRLVAHGAVGRGDRNRRAQHRHLHAAGDGVPVRVDGRGDRRDPARRRRRWSTRGKFPFVLGGEHSITRAGRRARWPRSIPGCRCCRSTRTPTCATRSWARRTTTRARCGACSSTRATTQVGIRSLSPEEAAAAPALPTEIFYDYNMRQRPELDRSRRRLAERDGLHHDRLRRPRSGDHAGGRHAGAGRAVAGTRRWRCCGG